MWLVINFFIQKQPNISPSVGSLSLSLFLCQSRTDSMYFMNCYLNIASRKVEAFYFSQLRLLRKIQHWRRCGASSDCFSVYEGLSFACVRGVLLGTRSRGRLISQRLMEWSFVVEEKCLGLTCVLWKWLILKHSYMERKIQSSSEEVRRCMLTGVESASFFSI